MIYLIGGPPKCGKTTLAKQLSKILGIPWVSSDTLEVVTMEYVYKYNRKNFNKLYPHSTIKGKTNDETYSLFSPKQIAKNYIKQAKTTYRAIDLFSICEIKDGNDYIIEGYHVTPKLAEGLIKKYGAKNFRTLFLLKSDIEKFVQDVQKSSTPNDWIITNTKEKKTLYKIATMINLFSQFFQTEANKYKFKVYNMDNDFGLQLKNIMKSLTM